MAARQGEGKVQTTNAWRRGDRRPPDCAAAKAVVVRKSLGGNPMPVRVRPRAPSGFSRRLPNPSSNIPTLRGNTGNRSVSASVPVDARLPPSRGMITRLRCEKWGKSGRCESRLPQWAGGAAPMLSDAKIRSLKPKEKAYNTALQRTASHFLSPQSKRSNWTLD